MNSSTVRGQELGIQKFAELASQVGYQGIEVWISDIQKFQRAGGMLKDLKKQIADLGLRVESAIGFANWIVDDESKRKQALEIAKKDMDLVRSIGGQRMAAPPAGTSKPVDLSQAAQRYRALLELGDKMGVTPQLELWGFSQPINRLGELIYIAAEAGHPKACLLPDVYHIYKGGSDFAGLNLISGNQIHVFHVNDYPAKPRNKISDADRVFPGKGVAPLRQIIQTIVRNGFSGSLSLELFNKDYWARPAKDVMQEGLGSMKEMVEKALSSN